MRQAWLLGALRVQLRGGHGLARGTDGEASLASLAGVNQLARFRSLVELARNGDPRALAAIDRMAHFLGSGLSLSSRRSRRR